MKYTRILCRALPELTRTPFTHSFIHNWTNHIRSVNASARSLTHTPHSYVMALCRSAARWFPQWLPWFYILLFAVFNGSACGLTNSTKRWLHCVHWLYHTSSLSVQLAQLLPTSSASPFVSYLTFSLHCCCIPLLSPWCRYEIANDCSDSGFACPHPPWWVAFVLLPLETRMEMLNWCIKSKYF